MAEVFEQLGEQPVGLASTGLSTEGFLGLEKVSDVPDPLLFARVVIGPSAGFGECPDDPRAAAVTTNLSRASD